MFGTVQPDCRSDFLGPSEGKERTSKSNPQSETSSSPPLQHTVLKRNFAVYSKPVATGTIKEHIGEGTAIVSLKSSMTFSK